MPTAKLRHLAFTARDAVKLAHFYRDQFGMRIFHTDPDYCETYGEDLDTGAQSSAQEYRAKQPGGRAFLHVVEYRPSPEVPDELSIIRD